MNRFGPWLIGLVVVFAALPAAAEDTRLSDLIERTMETDFAGSGVVMSSWSGMSAATTYEVSRVDHMSEVAGGPDAVMSMGSVTASRSGDDWYGVTVESWQEWELSDKYAIGDSSAIERMGRDATEVWITEGATRRVRVIVDEATSVPLLTEVYNADGRVYRTAAMIEIGPAGDMSSTMPDMHEMEVMTPITPPASLSATLAGYRRADAYAGPGDMAQVYYSDGLFSFSVFEWKRGSSPDEFVNATVVEIADHEYKVTLTPTDVWVHWHAPDQSYALVGDLPPDHLEAVLGELPEPGERGWLIRLWRWLFG